MNFFKQLRPLLRIAVALEQIASALVYFAAKDAQASNRIFIPGKRPHYATDQSDLMHTGDPATVDRLRAEEHDLVASRGFKFLDELESIDE